MESLFLIGLTITHGGMIALLKIIAIDIVLSGDNAVVIAMATRSLPKHHQNRAILLGTAGAVLLRIFFAVLVIQLLQIPYVNVIGGLLLLWIAYNLLVEENEASTKVRSHTSLLKAVSTIIIADAVMSLDNVVAITGAADGNIHLVILGVMVSIPIMIFGSKLIVKVLEKYRWIAFIGSGILAWTAGEMILTDQKLVTLLELSNQPLNYLIVALLTLTILLIGYIKSSNNSY